MSARVVRVEEGSAEPSGSWVELANEQRRPRDVYADPHELQRSLRGGANAVRAAQESAQVDTTACTITLTCPGAPAPKLSVQRQTTTGASRIEQLIRAMR